MLKKIARNILGDAIRRVRGSHVSTDFVTIGPEEKEQISSMLRDAWKCDAIPLRQAEIVKSELDRFSKGASVPVFDAFVDLLKDNIERLHGMNLLEIGCSSGYYSEVLKIAGLHVKYDGCDYSRPFIEMASKTYPECGFSVQDAVRLAVKDAAYDIVVSGCCILHIPEYEKAISETARVSREWVLFHRTPVIIGGDTRHYRKKGYGVDMVEIHFGEREFHHLIWESGLAIKDVITLSIESDAAGTKAIRSYLCKKRIPG